LHISINHSEAISLKRICLLLVCVIFAIVGASALAAAPSVTPPARAALFHTVELRKTKLGKILVNPAGSILYLFTKDHPKQDACVKISGCSSIWVPFPVQGKPSAGPGIRASLLSSIPLPEGGSQVTYAGHPLYIYSAEPTALSYVGVQQFGGAWDALNAKGKAVK
jgi:predicted lipoprotein with Yx(FWY)xxD motif